MCPNTIRYGLIENQSQPNQNSKTLYIANREYVHLLLTFSITTNAMATFALGDSMYED